MARSRIYGGDWNGSGLQYITAMATMILTVTSMVEAAESTKKIGL